MQVISERFADSLEYITARGGTVDAISDIIVTDCKASYINERVKLPIRDSVGRGAFVSALLAFDRDTDKVIATSILKQHKTNVLYLDSFFDFALSGLKSRWDEVCLLANENACYLSVQKTFTELLQFLISNIDCQMDDTMFSHIRETDVRNDVKKLFSTCTNSI